MLSVLFTLKLIASRADCTSGLHNIPCILQVAIEGITVNGRWETQPGFSAVDTSELWIGKSCFPTVKRYLVITPKIGGVDLLQHVSFPPNLGRV
jgi:hypothetical protein